MKVELRPTSEASKRTKERIAQHGPVFWWEGKDIDARRGEWLFRAESSWFGWLPLEDFEIISKKPLTIDGTCAILLP
tara:strand:- start:257 stop:487 length:231 start_codon:yes stop_codon:yes gene_type:complete